MANQFEHTCDSKMISLSSNLIAATHTRVQTSTFSEADEPVPEVGELRVPQRPPKDTMFVVGTGDAPGGVRSP